jgi:hypothetical protein
MLNLFVILLAVNNGLTALDNSDLPQFNNWRRKIDPFILDMADEDRCVYGQIANYNRTLVGLGDHDWEATVELLARENDINPLFDGCYPTVYFGADTWCKTGGSPLRTIEKCWQMALTA